MWEKFKEQMGKYLAAVVAIGTAVIFWFIKHQQHEIQELKLQNLKTTDDAATNNLESQINQTNEKVGTDESKLNQSKHDLDSDLN